MSDISLGLERLHISELMRVAGVPETLIADAFELSEKYPRLLVLLRLWRDDEHSRERIVQDLKHLMETAPAVAQTVEAWNEHISKHGSYVFDADKAWAEQNARLGPTTLYGVFGCPPTTSDREFLGLYSSPERAQAFVDAQPEKRRMWLQVDPIVVDAHPSDPFWLKPERW